MMIIFIHCMQKIHRIFVMPFWHNHLKKRTKFHPIVFNNRYIHLSLYYFQYESCAKQVNLHNSELIFETNTKNTDQSYHMLNAMRNHFVFVNSSFYVILWIFTFVKFVLDILFHPCSANDCPKPINKLKPLRSHTDSIEPLLYFKNYKRLQWYGYMIKLAAICIIFIWNGHSTVWKW